MRQRCMLRACPFHRLVALLAYYQGRQHCGWCSQAPEGPAQLRHPSHPMPAAATPSSCGGRWVLMGGQSARSVQNVLICPALQAGSKRLRAVLRTAQRRIKAARLAAGGSLAAAPATWWVHRRTVACCAAAGPRLSRWLATLHSWPLNQLFQGSWNWVCSVCMLPLLGIRLPSLQLVAQAVRELAPPTRCTAQRGDTISPLACTGLA